MLAELFVAPRVGASKPRQRALSVLAVVGVIVLLFPCGDGGTVDGVDMGDERGFGREVFPAFGHGAGVVSRARFCVFVHVVCISLATRETFTAPVASIVDTRGGYGAVLGGGVGL